MALTETVRPSTGDPWERCRLCHRPEHDDAALEAELEGRARMAAAREAAGVRLDDLDRLALDTFPAPSLLEPETPRDHRGR